MSEQSNEKQTSDPHGGLSASATTADELQPEENANDYGNTGQETTQTSDES
jgi:hypothetical protein